MSASAFLAALEADAAPYDKHTAAASSMFTAGSILAEDTNWDYHPLQVWARVCLYVRYSPPPPPRTPS